MDDCGGCNFCKDKTKFGEPNKLKQCMLYQTETDVSAEIYCKETVH